MNNVALAMNLATAPSAAFAELRERPRFLFPLLVSIVASAAVVYWYYSVVDIDWLKDQMFNNGQKLTEEQRAVAMGMMTRTTLLWSGLVGTFFVIPVFCLLQALFLWVAARITKVPMGFIHWFAMSSWTSLTALLSIVVSAILLVLSDSTQIGLGYMQPLSLNELLLHWPPGSAGAGLVNSLNIPSLLSWLLMIIGVRTWSQRSWVFSAAFVLVPIVAIYAVWALLAFR